MQFVIVAACHIAIGVRELSDLGGGGDFLARKIYAIPECVIVEIGMQTDSNCTNSKNKLVHNLPCGGKFFVEVKFRGYWIFQVSREQNCELNSQE